MMRRYAVFAVIFAFSILIGMQPVEIAEANPFMNYKNIEPMPGTIPPTITIISPLNSTAYSPESVVITFNVNKPQLAKSFTSITEVYYSIDNSEDVKVYSQYVNGTGTMGVPEYNNTFTLSSSSMGNHFLTVRAIGAVIYQGGIFFMESDATTSFIVSNQQILQPTPTSNISPTPTMTTSPTSNQSIASDNWINPTAITVTVVGITIVAVASVLLVYFKRRKGKP